MELLDVGFTAFSLGVGSGLVLRVGVSLITSVFY